MPPQLYQSHLVKAWNLFSPLNPLRFGEGADLSPQSLINAAIKGSNHTDFGDTYFMKPLEIFLASLEETGGLHPFGRFYVRQMIINFLKNRISLVNLWKSHPEILQETIKSPIVILGLPRTGSSHLFKSLSQDPNHRYLSNWEATMSQIPPAKITTFEQDPRRKVGRRILQLQNYLAPQMQNLHRFYLDGPEECTPLLIQSFISSGLGFMFNVPMYSKWLVGADLTEGYRYYKKILQTLQWTYPNNRWLLKAPTHMDAVKDLLHIFPDACIVQTHRDLEKVVPSFASLCLAFRSICQRDIDPHKIGEQSLQLLSTKMNQYLLEREKSDPQRFYDVQYEEFIKNPVELVFNIYQNFRIPLCEQAKTRIIKFSEKQKNYTSKHSYDLGDYGISAKQVEKSFRSYSKRFIKSSSSLKKVG